MNVLKIIGVFVWVYGICFQYALISHFKVLKKNDYYLYAMHLTVLVMSILFVLGVVVYFAHQNEEATEAPSGTNDSLADINADFQSNVKKQMEDIYVGDIKKLVDDKRLHTAYHEASHAVIGMLSGIVFHYPVYVTIIPESGTLGHVRPFGAVKKLSHMNVDIKYVLWEIRVLLAGPIGGDMFWGLFCLNASDLIRVKSIVNQMTENSLLLFGSNDYTAEHDLQSDIINGCKKDVYKLLKENWDMVEAIALALVEKGILDHFEIKNLMDQVCMERSTKSLSTV